ncbi:MFS transporter [Alicyclobacillus mali (ex Roth et al. 2021)]|uniref:MFS transporter n=1 Tax=Alicyclobacillus mali (ex Roth et al. 2021) TaxID=1123961 RepID=UPI000835E39A|nr:MFS transporter [Alicyclobacillus mali (ex Roth et al. 2021)]
MGTQVTPQIDESGFVTSAGRRGLLFASLGTSYLGLFMTYAGLIVVLLPEQVALLDPAKKVEDLAVVTSISSVATIFVQPIVGALSDRTRSRLGRRAPWMLFGALGGALCTVALQYAKTLFLLTVFWVLAQFLLNAFQGPLSSIVSDRVEMQYRATASALIGVGSSVGGTLGVILAGQLLRQIGIGYDTFAAIVVAVCLAFVLFNPDRSSKHADFPKLNWGRFFRGFLVDPRKHPDFAWAFAGRFFMIFAYQAIGAYQLYILTDYIHLPIAEAGGFLGLLNLIQMVAVGVSTLVFGRLSDHLQRRKMFVFASTLFIGVGALIPVFEASKNGMLLSSTIIGLGYGAYMAVDMALMIDVLPARDDAAKDLGILNIASNVPQALTPVIVAALLSAFHGNYASIFVYSAIATVVSSVFVFPIRSVR